VTSSLEAKCYPVDRDALRISSNANFQKLFTAIYLSPTQCGPHLFTRQEKIDDVVKHFQCQRKVIKQLPNRKFMIWKTGGLSQNWSVAILQTNHSYFLYTRCLPQWHRLKALCFSVETTEEIKHDIGTCIFDACFVRVRFDFWALI